MRYNNTISDEKRECRKLERRWRTTRLTIDKELYINQCEKAKELVSSFKMEYYSEIIQENSTDQKKLFSAISKLLHLKPETKLPTWDDTAALANALVDFFSERISAIRTDLDARATSSVLRLLIAMKVLFSVNLN